MLLIQPLRRVSVRLERLLKVHRRFELAVDARRASGAAFHLCLLEEYDEQFHREQQRQRDGDAYQIHNHEHHVSAKIELIEECGDER